MWNFPFARASLHLVSIALAATVVACGASGADDDAEGTSEAAYSGCRPALLSIGVAGASVTWSRRCDDEAPFYVLQYEEAGLPADCVASLDSSEVRAQRKVLDAALLAVAGSGLSFEEAEFLRGVVGRELRKAAGKQGAERATILAQTNASMRAFFLERACASRSADPACATEAP